ncbi:T9SS type A sorting domain-containing protein [Cytophagaceae bacterium ABcell3]|nr:T9SS type A sorting domain-containing protein [Cytophagaceae bacterium ABcell3]
MKHILAFSISYLVCLYGFAQDIVIKPLEYDESRDRKTENMRINAVVDTLALPFFEDFSQLSRHADTSKWMPGSGVHINREYPINPPTYNAATFDGLDANGKPYSTTLNQDGTADRLTSRPIDLSEIPEDYDSLYFSFYWQAAGRGERPDPGDFINLQFRNESGVWENIWTQRGDTAAFSNPNQFKYKSIKIDEPEYLYKGFQFRFTSHGRLSGNFDVWNIDYIFFSKGRDGTPYNIDMGLSKLPVSVLKNYTSMPPQQFFAAPEGSSELNPQLSYSLRNLDSPEEVRTYDDAIYLYRNSEFISAIPDRPQDILFTSHYQNNNLQWQQTPNGAIPFSESPFSLKYFIQGNTGDEIVNTVDYRLNDTASVITNFSNYLAYDDSTAELSIAIANEYGGKLAYKFDLNVPDTLTAVDIYFPRINKNVNNYNLRLHVWKDIQVGSYKEDTLLTQIMILKYSDDLNKMQRYILDRPLVIDGSFYIGFEQFTLDEIPVGFDVNTDNSDKMFYRIGRIWRQYDKEPGSMMMRPVFRTDNLVLSTRRPSPPIDENAFEEKKAPEFYPNPTSGKIIFRSPIQDVAVYDLSGKMVHKETFPFGDGQSIDLPYNLPDGMYLLHINDGKSVGVEKVMYRK